MYLLYIKLLASFARIDLISINNEFRADNVCHASCSADE